MSAIRRRPPTALARIPPKVTVITFPRHHVCVCVCVCVCVHVHVQTAVDGEILSFKGRTLG